MSEVAPKKGEYQDGQLWFRRKGSTITLGLTHAAIEELGQLEGLTLPDDGEDFQKGEAVVTVEGTKGSVEVTTPATGMVSEVNEAAKEETDLVSEDPLEEGWLVKLDIEDKTELKEYALED